MKKFTLAASSLLAITLSSAAFSAVTVTPPGANEGVIRFVGNIVEGGCSIMPESKDITVPLGDISSSTFKDVGDTSEAVGFNIILTNCTQGDDGTSTALFNNVMLSFRGEVNPLTGNEETLPLNASSSAQNVGIKMFEVSSANQDAITWDETEAITLPIPTPDADINIALAAQYIATAAAVTPGSANAIGYFKLSYN